MSFETPEGKKKAEAAHYEAMFYLSFSLLSPFTFPLTTETSDAPKTKSDEVKKSNPITFETFKLFMCAAVVLIRDAFAMASAGKEAVTIYSNSDVEANKPVLHTPVDKNQFEVEEVSAWKKAAPVKVNNGFTFKSHVDTSVPAVQKLSQTSEQTALQTALNTVFTKLAAILFSFAQALKEQAAMIENDPKLYANVSYIYAQPRVK